MSISIRYSLKLGGIWEVLEVLNACIVHGKELHIGEFFNEFFVIRA
jgi:hypothetical protein